MTDPCDWSDHMTVLRAHGKRLAKLHAADGSCQDYDSAYHYDASAVPVAGIPDLMNVLRRLLPLSDRCVVRGRIIGADKAKKIRRLAVADAETGDVPTLVDVPRRWLAVDWDGIARPAHIAADDLWNCGDIVLDAMPAPFQQATCIIQASANHGIKPGCRLRGWFWCDRPMTGRELKQWLKNSPCDPSIFNPVQPIYTAAPVFGPGRGEHIPDRLMELPGEDWLRCPSAEELAPPPPRIIETVRPTCTAGSARAKLYVEAALDSAQARIRNASLRHPAILAEACSLARLVHAGLLSQSELHNALWQAAADAGKDNEPEIGRIMKFALQNSSAADVPVELVDG